jgi:hypothetical protein
MRTYGICEYGNVAYILSATLLHCERKHVISRRCDFALTVSVVCVFVRTWMHGYIASWGATWRRLAKASRSGRHGAPDAVCKLELKWLR